MRSCVKALLGAVALLCLGAGNAPGFVWMGMSPTNNFFAVGGDVIFEADGSPAVTTTFGSRYFYEDGAQNPGQPVGLRPDRTYNVLLGSEAVPIRLQPYDANNIRKWSVNGDITAGTGTVVTLDVPQMNYQGFVLGFAGGGGSPTGALRFNYTDGTSSALLPFTATDWGVGPGAGQVEVFNVGRTNSTFPGSVEGGTNWSIFAQSFATDPNKILQSVSLARTGGSGEIGVFAFSGLVPEPGRAVLLGLAGLVMVARRRR
jgi:hypothetical protein